MISPPPPDCWSRILISEGDRKRERERQKEKEQAEKEKRVNDRMRGAKKRERPEIRL